MAPTGKGNRKINYVPVATTSTEQLTEKGGVSAEKCTVRRRETSNSRVHEMDSTTSCLTAVKHRLKEFVPLLLLCVYSCIGGVIFWHIEGSHARQTHNSVAVKNEILKNETAYTICKNYDDYILDKLINNDTLDAFESYTTVMTLLQNYARALGLPSEDVTEWHFVGSVFYSATVCTSIGYGNMAPKTRLGQAITMIYAVIGIPLVLYTLSIIGKYFCLIIWHTYVFVYQLTFGMIRKTKPTDITDFPLWLAMLCTLGWILMSAGVFCVLEPTWDFFKSFYFFFQSLTTIGFGDITPDEPKDMIFCFVFILVGMGLVGMCWNLMQMKMDKFVEEMMTKIREKYLQSELNDATMDEDGVGGVEKQIDKISNQENVWLTRLMSRHQHNALALEWRKRAVLRNKFTQTELETSDKEISTVSDFQDSSAQTLNISSVCHYTPQVPYREIKNRKHTHFGTSNDDFKNLLHEISHIITDCRNTVSSRDSSLSSCSNLDSDYPKSISHSK